MNGEYYRIDTGNGLINISASTSHGIFNGTQTLLSLLKGQEKLFRLEALSIRDYPDLPYRGQMLDIARNFTTVEHLKKLVDVISSLTKKLYELIHTHIARHTFITIMCNMGIPKETVIIATAHEDTKMIDEVYLHQSAQDNAMKLAAAIEEKARGSIFNTGETFPINKVEHTMNVPIGITFETLLDTQFFASM